MKTNLEQKKQEQRNEEKKTKKQKMQWCDLSPGVLGKMNLESEIQQN